MASKKEEHKLNKWSSDLVSSGSVCIDFWRLAKIPKFSSSSLQHHVFLLKDHVKTPTKGLDIYVYSNLYFVFLFTFIC